MLEITDESIDMETNLEPKKISNPISKYMKPRIEDSLYRKPNLNAYRKLNQSTNMDYSNMYFKKADANITIEKTDEPEPQPDNIYEPGKIKSFHRDMNIDIPETLQGLKPKPIDVFQKKKFDSRKSSLDAVDNRKQRIHDAIRKFMVYPEEAEQFKNSLV